MPQPTAFVFSSSTFVPGTLGRAEQIDLIFSSVAVGFQILAVQGVDSGAANAYVVTTSGGQDSAYSDGMIVEFKANNANTGASTIAVDSGAVVGLTNSNGQSLVGGAISANTWYRCLYNSTYSAFTVIAPTSLVTTSNTISSAAPTHLVGLASSGGVSTACAPIDVTFALDQSIAPTWTGAHIFGNTVTFNSTVSFATGLTLTGAASAYALTLDGSSSTGHSFGLRLAAGTNGSDVAVLVSNQAASTNFFEIDGAGNVLVGTPAGGGQGVGTINAQGLFVNGAAVKTTSISSANPSASVGLAAVNGSAATFMTSDSAPALSQAIAPTWTGAHTFTPSSAVDAVTINAAVNDEALIINGGTNTVNHFLMELITGQGSGFSSGLYIQAGTTAADTAIEIINAAGNVNIATVYGNGEFMFTPPTTAVNQTGGAYQVGMMDIPVSNSITAINSLSFRGQYVLASGNVTISANSSVPFPIGSTFMIENNHGSNITITVTSDTLTWLPSVATGPRTLAANSVATLVKVAATAWRIFGFGIT